MHVGQAANVKQIKMIELVIIESISHETIRQVSKTKLGPGKQKDVGTLPLESSDFVFMELVLDVYKMPYAEAFPLFAWTSQLYKKRNLHCDRKGNQG